MRPISRREILADMGLSIGGMALGSLWGGQTSQAAADSASRGNPLVVGIITVRFSLSSPRNALQ